MKSRIQVTAQLSDGKSFLIREGEGHWLTPTKLQIIWAWAIFPNKKEAEPSHSTILDNPILQPIQGDAYFLPGVIYWENLREIGGA